MVENCGYILCTFIKIKNQKRVLNWFTWNYQQIFQKKQQKNTKMKIRMWRRNGKTSSFKLKRVHFCYPSSSSSILFGFSSFLFFIWIINDIIYLSVKCFFFKSFYDTDITISTNMTWRKVYIFHKHIALKNINVCWTCAHINR